MELDIVKKAKRAAEAEKQLKKIKIIINNPPRHESCVVRLTTEASAVVNALSSKTGYSVGYLASQIIEQSADLIEIVSVRDEIRVRAHARGIIFREDNQKWKKKEAARQD